MKMKILYVSLVAGLCFLFVNYVDAAEKGLVGYWKFDEGEGAIAKDSSGKGSDGTVKGAGWVEGREGSAIQVRGRGDYVDCGNDASLSPANSITVEAWVKGTGQDAYAYIVSKCRGKDGEAWLSSSFALYTGVSKGLFFYMTQDGSTTLSPDAGPKIWDDTWHHIAGVYDKEKVRLYVDGSEIGSGTAGTGNIVYANYPLLLGIFSPGNPHPFNGIIDEVRVYNRALTDEEIRAHSKKKHYIVIQGSSFYKGYPVENAADGVLHQEDPENFWASDLGKDKGAWLKIDLGKSTEIGTIRIQYREIGGEFYALPKTITFQVSDDGAAWKQIGKKSDYLPLEQEPYLEKMFDYKLNTRAKYVRLLFEDGAQVGDQIEIAEVEVVDKPVAYRKSRIAPKKLEERIMISKPQVVVSANMKSDFREQVSLDGKWQFQAEKKNIGVSKGWYLPEKKFSDSINVPGCIDAQGYKEYTNGWYRKDFAVSKDWKGKAIWLKMGGIFPAADIWINGKFLAFCNSSRCGIRWDISDYVRLDADNVLVVRIHRAKLRLDGVLDIQPSASYKFPPWGGIYRSVELEATEKVYIEDVFIASDIHNHIATAKIKIQNKSKDKKTCLLRYSVSPESGGKKYHAEKEYLVVPPGGSKNFSLPVKIEKVRLWSPQHPHLYKANVVIVEKGKPVDKVSVRFGMREIRVKGDKLFLNDKPLFLRGYGDDQFYPETISPPADKEYYLKNLRTAKDYGFNYGKSCVDIFTAEYVAVADELGIMITQEMPFGLNPSFLRTKRYNPTNELMSFYRRELKNIVKYTRNNPSVINYAMASELNMQRGQTQKSFNFFNRELPLLAKSLNPQALATDTTSGAGLKVKTKLGERITDLCEQGTFMGLDPLHKTRVADSDRPRLFHEYSYWASYLDMRLKKRYKGLPVSTYWFEVAEKAARQNGVYDLIPQFIENSQKVEAICRAEGLEFARRQPNVRGFVLWLIRDLVWAREGLLNEFWEPKGASAEEFRMVNSDTILLLGEESYRRCYWIGEKVNFNIIVSHFGEEPLRDAMIRWNLKRGDKIIQKGESRIEEIKCGFIGEIASMEINFPQSKNAEKLIIETKLLGAKDKELTKNRWNFWSFPKIEPLKIGKGIRIEKSLSMIKNNYPGSLILNEGKIEKDVSLIITSKLNKEIADYLKTGGRVILISDKELPSREGVASTCFKTLYHSANCGTIITDHPSIEGFPHEGFCDLQFVHLIHGIHPISLDKLKPAGIAPIIRSIGHYKKADNAAYLFEAKVEEGKLLATSFKITKTYTRYPQSQFLLDRLIKYALSEKFQPKQELQMQCLSQ